MQVRIKSVFVDKNTKERYKLNKIIEISEERFKEIKEYVEIVKKEGKVEK